MRSPERSPPIVFGDETGRLQALQSYRILDTAPEPDFDRLACLAAYICGTPMATITLVDEHRQWFKATVGFDPGLQETPRSIAFCAAAIEGREPLIVEDASVHPRFHDNPLVLGPPGLRFYAGVPLRSPSGFALGTLAVLDRVPRVLDAQQHEALSTLAQQVMLQMEMRRRALLAVAEADDRLQLSGSLLAIAGRVAHLGGWQVDVASGRVHWSEETASIHDLPPGSPPELRSALLFFVPACRRALRHAYVRCIRRGDPFDLELDLVSATGTRRAVRMIGKAVRDAGGHIVQVHGALQDISEKIQAEQAVQRIASRLTRTLDSITDAFYAVDRSWRLLGVNKEFERLLQRRRDQVLGRVLWEVFPDALGTAFELEARAAVAEQRPHVFEAYYPPVQRWFEVRNFPSDEGLAVYFRDVSERRAWMEQLHLLESSIGHLNDIVMITDAQVDAPGPRIVYVNGAFERLSGYVRDEVLGRNPRFLQGPRTRRDELDRIRAALAERRGVRAELINYTRTGREHWVEMEISPIHDAQGRCTHFVAVERDITERKRAEAERRALEDQLRQAQRLESIGTLAGGLAHEFNNILGAVLGNLELAQDKLPQGHAALHHLGQIRTSSQRARALVQHLLAFGGKQARQRTQRLLSPLVQEALELVRNGLPEEVELVARISQDPLFVVVDANQLQQALLQLCHNARQALPPGGGRIVVGLDEANLGPDEVASLGALTPGCHAHLWVQDNGDGMDAETRRRIFEPFFTTRPTGQGTGLGLAVVHGMTMVHDGALRVDSAPGEGSTFHLYLPALHDPSEDFASTAPGALDAVHGGGQRVVCVDDDEMVLLTLEALLQRLGYQVTCYADPRLAAQALQQRPGQCDLLVTDYNMPELDGLALARRALQARPDLPVLIVTGYMTEELRTEALQAGVRELLHKQNCVEELGGVVARVLASQASLAGPA
ncbi:PAS domain S-box protein [Eleftheria terrae]|uniref:PAS domain S-box protein n=1 Tax=Eleftheria terrae TaxID=1597781 RepID=UPI00263B598A|nr:PAS domain S-box protein [Eleftheria terrae]WKB53353.1 PAS domain S-box protein [Eleftheria terrae]